MTEAPIIVWFRQDLRLRDNPALMAAHETGRPIIPLYILDDHNSGKWGGEPLVVASKLGVSERVSRRSYGFRKW